MRELVVPTAHSVRPSPCVGICRLDKSRAFCLGCARTRDEIALWSTMSGAERDEVWKQLPDRQSALALRIRIMPWSSSELADWVIAQIEDQRGTFVTGAPGAVAEFPCTSGRNIEVEASHSAIVARASDAAFRLRISDNLRAFAFEEGGPVVLGLVGTEEAGASRSTVEALGSDSDAIGNAYRTDQLFDLGIDRKASRFCIRTSNSELTSLLFAQSGRHWSSVMAECGWKILSVNPHRVVESACARIEVYAPIPPPSGKSPDGAHTHFLPSYLASGEEIAANLALPPSALPAAIFYPLGNAV